jgi:endonuclease/exonuclease/phosphatase family metal-dependent hydrolase
MACIVRLRHDGGMTTQTIKVASYNIRKAIGTDRRRNPERILAVLTEIDADIIALQEADRRFGSRLAAIPHELLDHHSDYKAVPLSLHNGGMGWHGNALLVRKSATILSHDVMHLPYLEPRGAVTAHVTIGGKNVRLFGMHLDLSGLWRRRQAAAIIQIAQALPKLPTILMGDLNEWSASRGSLADFARHYSFASTGRSFHAQRPIARLDRIMHCDLLIGKSSGAHDSVNTRRASDHLPIWAKLTFR